MTEQIIRKTVFSDSVLFLDKIKCESIEIDPVEKLALQALRTV